MSSNPQLPAPKEFPTNHASSATRQQDYVNQRKTQALIMGVKEVCERCDWYLKFVYFGNEAWLKDGWQSKNCYCRPPVEQKRSNRIIYEDEL